MQENTHQGTARMIRRAFVVAAVVLLAGGALAGCSDGRTVTTDVSSDPEALSRAVVEASYHHERMYEFLWEHASPRLKNLYDLDQQEFRSETSQRAGELLLDSTVDASHAQVSYSQLGSVRQYDLLLRSSSDSQVTFFVTVVPETDDTWAYCEVSVEDPRLGGAYFLFGQVGGACY